MDVMTALDDAQGRRLFDAVRMVKGKPLTQGDVDLVNRALAPGPRHADKRAIDLIHSFETLKLTSYKDPGSKNGLPITCGLGTTVDENGGPIPLGVTWTREKADRLFARDLAKAETAVERLVGAAPTTDGQFGALVSFAYNVNEGDGGLKTSTLLRKHMNGDYGGAKAEFARWRFNDGKELKGLVRRRAAEAELYAS